MTALNREGVRVNAAPFQQGLVENTFFHWFIAGENPGKCFRLSIFLFPF